MLIDYVDLILRHPQGGYLQQLVLYSCLRRFDKSNELFSIRLNWEEGGWKKITKQQPGILEDLEMLVDPLSREDPESPLRWTCKSTYQLRDELMRQGYTISQPQVGKLLVELEDSLQAPRIPPKGGLGRTERMF